MDIPIGRMGADVHIRVRCDRLLRDIIRRARRGSVSESEERQTRERDFRLCLRGLRVKSVRSFAVMLGRWARYSDCSGGRLRKRFSGKDDKDERARFRTDGRDLTMGSSNEGSNDPFRDTWMARLVRFVQRL
jgi:hypothetical protein